MQLTIIDSYDSFTNNLTSQIREIEQSITINQIQYEEIPKNIMELEASNGIIISPGQGDPRKYVQGHKKYQYLHKNIPVLGVCLGFQILGIMYGGQTKKIAKPRHGEQSNLNITQFNKIFHGIKHNSKIGLYHSHYLSKPGENLNILAKDKEGIIMGIKHYKYPIYGVQFHLESFLTEQGTQIMNNFLKLCYEEHLGKNE